MTEFVFSIIILLGSLGAILVIAFGKFPRNPKVITIIAGGLGIILAGGLFFAGLFHSVPTKSVGVVTSYGKVIGAPYGPGGHLMAPWRTLNIVRDTIQSDSFSSANGSATSPDSVGPSGITGYCIKIRLGGMNQGCADVQLQTRVDEGAIPALYADYSSYGPNLTQDVDQYVVKRELTTVLNHVLGDYNVIADVSAQLEACSVAQKTSCTTQTSSQFSQFDPQIISALQGDPQIKGQISVLGVNLQYVNFDVTTEAAITKIQQDYTETVGEIIQEQTNTATSAANAALVTGKNGQQSLTPSILEYDCYQTIQDAIKAGYQGLPATMSCGSSSSGVLISGK